MHACSFLKKSSRVQSNGSSLESGGSQLFSWSHPLSVWAPVRVPLRLSLKTFSYSLMCAYTHDQEKEGKQLISNILVLEADTANKIIINKHRGWDLEMRASDRRTMPRAHSIGAFDYSFTTGRWKQDPTCRNDIWLSGGNRYNKNNNK